MNATGKQDGTWKSRSDGSHINGVPWMNWASRLIYSTMTRTPSKQFIITVCESRKLDISYHRSVSVSSKSCWYPPPCRGIRRGLACIGYPHSNGSAGGNARLGWKQSSHPARSSQSSPHRWVLIWRIHTPTYSFLTLTGTVYPVYYQLAWRQHDLFIG